MALTLAALLSACALGLDFDELDNTCEPPSFDLALSDTFCSGEAAVLELYEPTSQNRPGLVPAYVTSVTEGDIIATGVMSFFDAGDGCIEIAPGIDVGRIEPDGTISPVGGLTSADLGIRLPLAGACPAGLSFVWPTEIAIVQTDPIRVMASFGDGGVLEYRIDVESGFQTAYHVAGTPGAPTQRECVASACVTSGGQWCRDSADCHPLTYCSEGTCLPFPSCTLDGGCAADERLVCATRRGTCALGCSSDLDCPHPYLCDAGRCGGGGCGGTTDICLVGDEVCAIDACLPTCTVGGNTCGEGLECFPLRAEDAAGVCATLGRHGTCLDDADCSLNRVHGFETVPGNDLTLGLPAVGYAAGTNFRIAVGLFEAVNPYLLPRSEGTQVSLDLYTDILYVEEYGAVYVALGGIDDDSDGVPTANLVRFEWGDVPAELTDAIETASYTRFYAFDIEPETRLLDLHRVGDYLVTIEMGDDGMGNDAVVYSRVLRLDADRQEDLEPMFEGSFSLGSSVQASVGPLPGNEDVWVWGLDRVDGAELVFYDMRDPSSPRKLGELAIDTRDGVEREFVSVTEAGIFVSGAAGITPIVVELADDEH